MVSLVESMQEEVQPVAEERTNEKPPVVAVRRRTHRRRARGRRRRDRRRARRRRQPPDVGQQLRQRLRRQGAHLAAHQLPGPSQPREGRPPGPGRLRRSAGHDGHRRSGLRQLHRPPPRRDRQRRDLRRSRRPREPPPRRRSRRRRTPVRAPPRSTELQTKADAITNQRNTLFKGETLRGLLLSTFAWSTIGRIAGIAATVAFVAAGLMTALVILGVFHLRKARTTA